MEQAKTWYVILTKQQFKKWTFWFQLFLFMFVMLMVTQIRIPTKENCRVLLYAADTEYAGRLTRLLLEADSAFDFELAEDPGELEKQVTNGTAECGFVITEKLDEDLSKESLRDDIVYIYSSFTTKGLIAKETVYAGVFHLLTEQKAGNEYLQFFQIENEEISQRVLEENRRILSEETLFRTEYLSKEGTAISAQTPGDQTQLIRGMTGLLLFMLLLLMRGEDLASFGKNYWDYLPGKKQVCFLLVKASSILTIPAIAGILFIRINAAYAPFLKDLVLYVLFLLLSFFWVYLFGKLFKRMSVYYCWMFTILLVQVVICPVFRNPGSIRSGFQIPGYLFPLGIYLGMF